MLAWHGGWSSNVPLPSIGVCCKETWHTLHFRIRKAQNMKLIKTTFEMHFYMFPYDDFVVIKVKCSTRNNALLSLSVTLTSQ
jgi:hypothetical protein